MQSPQNPYNTPDPYGAPSTSSRGPVISFDTISEAWKLLQPNLGTWIGAFVIYIVCVGLLNLVQQATMTRDARGMPHFGPLTLLFSLLGFVVGQFFIGGMMRMAINNTKTGRADLSQMFSVADVLPSLIGAGILTSIASVIGFMFCIVPGLLLSGLFMFVSPLIVDRKLGIMDAINTSINALKSQMWMALLYILVIGIVAGLGALACGVGALVTAPLSLLALALTYRDFFLGGSTPGSGPVAPRAPIADPFG